MAGWPPRLEACQARQRKIVRSRRPALLLQVEISARKRAARRAAFSLSRNRQDQWTALSGNR
jgi:hypothetical protein